jgi:hypothetical protein
VTDNPAKKQRGRPFPKGVSGNPSGCQTGSRRRVSLLLDSLAEGLITSPERVLEATAKVTAAVSDGSLSPDEGVLVSQIVEASRRAIETVELERRIAALEAGAGGGPNRPETKQDRCGGSSYGTPSKQESNQNQRC